MSLIQEFIKKLSSKKGKILSITDLKSIGKQILNENFSNKKIYKLIYNIKNKGYLISVKKDIFFVKHPNENIDLENIEDQIYWQILKLHIKKYLSTNFWYIGGKKALQIHILDFSIPETIYISNDQKNAKEVILKNRFVYFKKYSKLTSSFKNLLKKNIEKEKIGNINFPTANLELSILESLYSPPEEEKKEIYDLVKKILKKKKKIINWDAIQTFIKLGKFHSSINRLYLLSKFDTKTNQIIKDIIKRYSQFLDID